jgi:hypothetical protein
MKDKKFEVNNQKIYLKRPDTFRSSFFSRLKLLTRIQVIPKCSGYKLLDIFVQVLKIKNLEHRISFRVSAVSRKIRNKQF